MANISNSLYNQFTIEEYVVEQEPFYLPVRDEVELFEAAYAANVPILLKGPRERARPALWSTWRGSLAVPW